MVGAGVGTIEIRAEVVVAVKVATTLERLVWLLEPGIHCCKPKGVLHHESKGARTPLKRNEKRRRERKLDQHRAAVEENGQVEQRGASY